VLVRLAAGERIGTLLEASTTPLAARKQWLADHLQLGGRLEIDQGAARALAEGGKSLLPIGVKSVQGDFERGSVVACIAGGKEIARGLVNYGAQETRRIAGRPSSEIESVLGYIDGPELIHRDNLVLL
jgi:glutamate 5-kinase